MQASFRLGSLFGITIHLHFTWFLVFALVTFSLVNQFAGRFPNLSGSTHWLIGVTASLLFFGSVLFHELAHSLLAIKYGRRVRSITLVIFGGISDMESETTQPIIEIWVSLIGPVSNFFLSAVFSEVWQLSHDRFPVVGSVAGWIALINFALGAVNLLPGLPLDGGRVLRGIVWKITGSQDRGTKVAAGAGRSLGLLIILLGLWLAFVRGDFASGLWSGLIGWFLINAAETSLLQLHFQRAFSNVKAFQVMATDYPYVPGGTRLREFVENYLLQSAGRCFIVGDPLSQRGIITLEDVKKIPKDEWESTSVQGAMRAMDAMYWVTPQTSIEEVLKILDTNNIAQVAVVEEEKLLGMIGRDHLLRLIRNRLDLSA